MFVFGVVYKIHDPHDVYLDATGVVLEKCYVGKTELTAEERYKGHINQSKNLANDEGTDGKLHAMLRAKGHETFKLEVLFEARDGHELAAKERELVVKFRCVEIGYNKVIPSGEYQEPSEPGEFWYDETRIQYTSHFNLIRKLSAATGLNLSYSTFKKDLNELEQDISRAMDATITSAKETAERVRERIVYGVAFSGEHWLAELAKDKRVNSLRIPKKTIEVRLRKNKGNFKSEEEALETILKEPLKKTGQVGPLIAPNNTALGPWPTYTAMRKELVAKFPDHDFPTANNISGYINDKGYTLEQAVRFKPPPWRLTPEWQEADACVEQGYLLIGKPKAGKPCISHEFKRVFATQAQMANALNYDNSDLGRLLRDHTPDEVLRKLDRVFR